MVRGKEIGPEKDAELYRLVQDLAQRTALPMPRVSLFPNRPLMPLPRAATQHAAIAMTHGMRRILTSEDIAVRAAF